MEQDLTRWLKDHLGLRHMSEADLNGLVYHPRHGGLCRRFVKFLAESTLCANKFPNVAAKEEWERAKACLQDKDHELYDTLLKLDQRIRTDDNIERELRALKERHHYMKRKEHLLRTTNEALQQMADRPNYTFEQVRKRLEQSDYLNSASLEDIYSTTEVTKHRPEAMSDRNKRRVEERFNELVQSAEYLHRSIQSLFSQTQSQVTRVMDDIREIKKPNIEELKALTISRFEPIKLQDADQQEQEVAMQQAGMSGRISAERKVVSELKKQYNRRKAELDDRHASSIKEDADFRAKMRECEAILEAE